MHISTSAGPFSGLWIPLVTPFRDGAVDHPALRRLVQTLASQGVAGFVACGSTGEAAALDADEQRAVLDTTLAAADGLPVVMGIGGYHLGKALDAVRLAATRPIAGLLIPPPTYIRPSQQGLLHWFGALADASPVPVILYDIPYRTGVELQRETMLRLASHPMVRAVKDCGGDTGKTQALLADGRLQILAGEDLQIFSAMALGASGAIAASAHLHTARFAEVIRRLAEGHLSEARALWLPLLPWIEAAFAEPNPAPVKALLAQAGTIGGELRAPMSEASTALVDRLRAISAAIAPV